MASGNWNRTPLGVSLSKAPVERTVFSGHRPGETLHPGIEPLLRQLGLAERFQAAVGGRHSGIWLSWGGPKQFQPYGTAEDLAN
jgi:hypothetical protein